MFFLYRLIFPVLLLLPLLVLFGCEKKSTPEKATEEAKTAATEAETKLTTIPEDYDRWSNISFSADGQQVFYEARKKERKFIVVASTGGVTTGPQYEGVSFLVKSPDGRRFAFGGKKGRKQHLIVDNKELKFLYQDEIAPSAFSPDGRFVACEAGSLKEKKWFIVLTDGKKEVYRSPVYPDTYRQPVFSPDGRLLVFELGDDKRNVENKNKKRTIFFLDVSSRKIVKKRVYDGYRVGSLSFSSDSSRVVYDTGKDGKNFIVLQDLALNKERTVELPHAMARQVVLSPEGKKIAYVANKDENLYLFIGSWENPAAGKEYGPFNGIMQPVFGHDSAVAYLAMKGGKWRNGVGDKEGAAKFNGVGDAPVFGPDGAKIAYAANKGGHQNERGLASGKWYMVIAHAGKPDAVKEGPAYDMVITPVFSPDGRHIAYRARKGPMENAKRFIVIADAETGKVIKEGPVGDEIWPPVWSADGRSIGYGARIGRELWWKVQTLP